MQPMIQHQCQDQGYRQSQGRPRQEMQSPERKKYNDIIINAIDIAIAMIVIGIAKCPGRTFIGTRVRQHQL